ncbi:unnamed protein product [Scytosiphon promiscuus]
MLQEISVLVRSVRHLPQSFFNDEKERELALSKHEQRHQPSGRGAVDCRRCLRAQAKIANETRETGNSSWGRGVRSRQAMWLRGADKLSWSLPEQQFKKVKAYTPVCKVHVYATDPSAPNMDTSDSVGWFVVDMRDLAGQRQQERWVKLQGASPAEVLISSSLAMARDPRQEYPKEAVEQQRRPTSSKGTSSAGERGTSVSASPPSGRAVEAVSEGTPLSITEGGTVASGVRVALSRSEEMHPSSLVDAVSELDALPVGPGADGEDAEIFSLAISVNAIAANEATELSGLAYRSERSGGAGLWLSYSIFGVVVQTDRFESLLPPTPGGGGGGGPVLEPMMDSFRLRATLQGLCHFLGEAPPLQVYLCTEGRILANADVDMSLLLPRGEWESRHTREFGRTGMEGDFHLHLPGQTSPVSPGQTSHGGQDDSRPGAAVVTVGAELTRSNSNADDLVRSGDGDAGKFSASTAAACRTWSYFARRRRRGVITAALQRLELKPASPDGGDNSESVSDNNFRVVGCGKRGEVFTEDSRFLETIMWRETRGDDGGRAKGALAEVRVLAPSGADDGNAGVAIAKGVVPWPSSLAGSGRQHVSVKLVSPGGTEVGSCRVCLALTLTALADADDESGRVTVEGAAHVAVAGAARMEEGSDSELFAQEIGGVGVEAGVGTPEMAVKTSGVHAEERDPKGTRRAAAGAAPRSYRMSINLASVKGLENAAYVVACYHYPYFGTYAPVRTSLVWAAPRMDTPLPNSCCTFSFGMSFDRLAGTTRDNSLVVSLRSKDRFKEEEIGLVTIPLLEVVESRPQYFRCRDTGKTFTSLSGFRAHLKSRQRSGDLSAEDASKITPVKVKVLDRYLTVASVASNSNLNGPGTSPPSLPSGQAARLCSLRVILVLEDMGLTGDPGDTEAIRCRLISSYHFCFRPLPSSLDLPPFLDSLSCRLLSSSQGPYWPISPVCALFHRGIDRDILSVELERSRVEYERWRIAEEASFAKLLREKDQALEEKWESREAARRRDLTNAQADYSKLEGKLRKALSEVEARERQLKAREESWRSEHAQKLSELQLLQRRLREETKHHVDLERMKVKALERQVTSHVKSLEDARSRAVAADEDLERFKQQQRRTPEGGLRQELFRLGAAKAEAEAQAERERSLKNKALLEKEEYRAHIHKLARALKRHQERESTCARREMEQLRLEYLAREERFILDGDRNELRTIKHELDELRHVSLVQEAQAGLAKIHMSTAPFEANPSRSSAVQAAGIFDARGGGGGGIGDSSTSLRDESAAPRDPGPSPSAPPRPTPAPAHVSVQSRRAVGPVPRGGKNDVKPKTLSAPAAGQSDEGRGRDTDPDADIELARLMEWRDELLGTGMYTPHNPIVSELNRRIARATGGVGRGGSEAMPPQRQE